MINEQYKLPFLEVCSLQQMAAAQVIVSSIRTNDDVKKSIDNLFEMYDHFYDGKRDIEYWYDQTESLFRSDGMMNLIATMNRCIDKMAIPSSIGTILKKFSEIVCKEMANWIRYYDRHIFKATEFVSKASNFIQIVKWNGHGLIDYSATARILIETEELSEDAKFRIIAVNCFEDVAATLSPDTVEGYFDSIKIKENNRRYDLIFLYWTAAVTNNFTRMHNIIREYGYPFEANESDVYFLRWTGWAHPTSTEYFFNKLNMSNKINLCKELIPIHGMRNLCLWRFISTVDMEKEMIVEDNCRFFVTLLCDVYWRNHFSTFFNRYREILTRNHLALIIDAFDAAMYCVKKQFCYCRNYISMFVEFWNELNADEKQQMFRRRVEVATVIRHIHYPECFTKIIEIFLDIEYNNMRDLLFSRESKLIWVDLLVFDDCQQTIQEFINQILTPEDASRMWKRVLAL